MTVGGGTRSSWQYVSTTGMPGTPPIAETRTRTGETYQPLLPSGLGGSSATLVIGGAFGGSPGGLACPPSFAPQHATDPSTRRAQVSRWPAATVWKRPGGAALSP